ncbi:MAG: anthranilate synthase component I family protein [Clostridia bacterium]|nr:anthranilate synthase component I family protein [Clostridia bacterium]
MEAKETRTAENGFKYAVAERRVPAGGLTPLAVLKRAMTADDRVFVLEKCPTDADGKSVWNRWSVICYAPRREIVSEGGQLRVRTGNGEFVCVNEDPVRYLRRELAENTQPKSADPETPPFRGGYAGYFSYEYISLIEPTCTFVAENSENYRDFHLMFFDKVFAFDREKNMVHCICNVPAADENAAVRAEADLNTMQALLTGPEPQEENFRIRLKGETEPLYDRDAHARMVAAAKEYIQRGDVAQIVLSNGKTVCAEGNLVDTYARLCATDPTRHMCYFKTDDVQAAMASPEPIAYLRNGIVMTERLAGTVARGKTPEEDAAKAEALRCDPKSVDEHNMLVDDSRNEFGFVSEIGSVEVSGYLNIVRTSRVMSLGSTITGKLKPEMTALDVIDAIVPSGAVSGAPKIRACEVINEIEGDRRGLYGSAVGMIGMDGDADFFVFIRSAFMKNGKVIVRAGGGITIDSDADEEYNEVLFKADAVLKAVEHSREAAE